MAGRSVAVGLKMTNPSTLAEIMLNHDRLFPHRPHTISLHLKHFNIHRRRHFYNFHNLLPRQTNPIPFQVASMLWVLLVKTRRNRNSEMFTSTGANMDISEYFTFCHKNTITRMIKKRRNFRHLASSKKSKNRLY